MELKTNNIIYHVRTFEDLQDLARRLDELGCVWESGTLLTDYEGLENTFKRFGSESCWRLEDKIVTAFYKKFRGIHGFYEPCITYKRTTHQSDERKEQSISSAIEALELQYKKGLERYNKTIAECDLTPKQLFKMAQEELADGLIYVSEALKRL